MTADEYNDQVKCPACQAAVALVGDVICRCDEADVGGEGG